MAFARKLYKNLYESILLPHPTVPISIFGCVGLFLDSKKEKENIEDMYIIKIICKLRHGHEGAIKLCSSIDIKLHNFAADSFQIMVTENLFSVLNIFRNH